MVIRMCCGCRGKAEKESLVRIVAQGGVAVVDPRFVGEGRGAYLHHDRACLEMALRRRALQRALRVPLDCSSLADSVTP